MNTGDPLEEEIARIDRSIETEKKLDEAKWCGWWALAFNTAAFILGLIAIVSSNIAFSRHDDNLHIFSLTSFVSGVILFGVGYLLFRKAKRLVRSAEKS